MNEYPRRHCCVKASQCTNIAPLLNIPIITSIMPKRIEEQKKAISTWLAQGFTPIAINYDDEIENLKQLFPEVRFITAQMNSVKKLGKKRIFINEIILQINTCMAQNNYRFIGIINSDVSLYNIDIDLLSHHVTSSLVFSRRADIKTYEYPDSTPYNYGFDAFFFHPDFLQDFPQCSLALGEPWWDIAIPLWAILHDRPVVSCSPALCFHLIHEIKWTSDSFFSLGKIVYDIFEPLFTQADSQCPYFPETLQVSKTNSIDPTEFISEFCEFSTTIVNSIKNKVNFLCGYDALRQQHDALRQQHDALQQQQDALRQQLDTLRWNLGHPLQWFFRKVRKKLCRAD